MWLPYRQGYCIALAAQMPTSTCPSVVLVLMTWVLMYWLRVNTRVHERWRLAMHLRIYSSAFFDEG
jgi:hypothetical protein